MKEFAPDYYRNFHCIASQCRHTCCQGWEIEIDNETLKTYQTVPEIAEYVNRGTPATIRLKNGERCPFLTEQNLCSLILRYGPQSLCQICRDHPRFRNFWSDRIEIGLGFVCEEAARLILTQNSSLRLVPISDDGIEEDLPPDEAWLLDFRSDLLSQIRGTGPRARLLETLIYRHLPDALYDGRLTARLRFLIQSFREITRLWEQSDGTTETLVEIVRRWSYDVEYDEEEKEKRISSCNRTETEETVHALCEEILSLPLC